LAPSRSVWLVPLFLIFGVLAPAGCVVWFMNTAVRSETDASGQSVKEAYRSNLQLLRDRADSFWRDRAAAIGAAARGPEPVAFQRIVTQGLADSVILPHYPAIGWNGNVAPQPQGAWERAAELERNSARLTQAAAAYARLADTERDVSLAARAAQGTVRCLLRSGDRQGALRALAKYFERGRLLRGYDPSGRLIAADEMLLAVRLNGPVDRLEALLNDYRGTAMPSTQRLFLMDELRSAFPASVFPGWDAERIALQFLVEGGSAGTAEAAFERTRNAEIWRLPASNGRIAALYRTASITRATEAFLRESSTLRNVSFIVSPPGTLASTEAIPAGRTLPGWTLSFALSEPALIENAVNARIASYFWIGYLMIACLTITGVIVVQWLRREARLARLKTDLVAAVSHELRTPLSSIRLLVEALLDDAEPEPGKTREYLKMIDGENIRLARLIENFLTFSRLERRKQQFDFAPTRVSAVVEKAIATIGDRLHPPACRLELDLKAGGATILADEDALVRVLVNLLDNACKYSPQPRHICIAACEADSTVTLSVRDNGVGVGPRDRRRIFRRFYQVDQRLARESGGCGLGLSIVESLVRAHGGAVRVESKPGEGSTFYVRIPIGGPCGLGKAA
jgi:signal transduction histidine kinase